MGNHDSYSDHARQYNPRSILKMNCLTAEGEDDNLSPKARVMQRNSEVCSGFVTTAIRLGKVHVETAASAVKPSEAKPH